METDKDPIIARASAAGRGGIGIIRISGSEENLQQLLKALFKDRRIEPRHAHLLPVRDAQDNIIDQTIVLYFPGPASYTGETVLEIQAHGGPAVMQMIISRCMELGASMRLRQAQPGEFSRRAFLNGRLDLAQAEAVADLIEASSQAAARAAARSMQGEFSREVLWSCGRTSRPRSTFRKRRWTSLKTGTSTSALSSLPESLRRFQKMPCAARCCATA